MAGQDCEDAEWKRLPYNTYSQTGLRSLTRRKRKRKMKQSPSVSKYQDVGAQQLSPLCVKLNFLFIFFFCAFFCYPSYRQRILYTVRHWYKSEKEARNKKKNKNRMDSFGHTLQLRITRSQTAIYWKKDIFEKQKIAIIIWQKRIKE